MAPSRRRSAIAAVFGLIAMLAAVGGHPSGGHAEPAPDPSPSTEPSASPSPPPAPQVALVARDIDIGAGYWQGAAETYRLSVRVRNTGAPAVRAVTQVFLPVGVLRTAVDAPGCDADGLSIDCPLASGATVTIAVAVTVAPGLWRDPPTGTVRTTASAGPDTDPATDQTTFGLNFPPGPPTPGIDLSLSDPFLPTEPADPAATTEATTLEVRLLNTGEVQADGAVEVVTPPGVGIATVPAQCVGRERISADRDRCELGRIPAGQRVTLRFGLVVTRAARAEAPLLGSVHASLVPTGQDLVTVVASYQVLVTDRQIEPLGPTASDGPAVTIAQPGRGAGPGAGNRTTSRSDIGQIWSILPMLLAVLGVFSVLAGMAILSHRRRTVPK
jgi:hypothetical protein